MSSNHRKELNMKNIEIKSIETFTENETPKTKLIIDDNNSEKEIILEGKGQLKIAAVEA